VPALRAGDARPGVPVDEGRVATTAREAAAAPSGRVGLSHCATCGMVYDTAPRVENVVSLVVGVAVSVFVAVVSVYASFRHTCRC
jgi:hypothetical protein